jgi:serum/glucocorticoid-regulated kinase 2
MQGALQYAIGEGHRHVLKPLLNSSIDLNFHLTGRNLRRFVAPLLWAVEEEDVELAKMFIASGADPNVYTWDGKSALVRAVVRHNEEMVRALISGTDRRRRTQALTRSMDYPDGRIARILLDNGTVTDFQDGDSAANDRYGDGCRFVNVTLIPPLISAVILGHSGLVRLLVARGANVNVEYHNYIGSLSDWFLGGPLLLAIKLGNEEIANFLRDQGAKEIVKGLSTKFEN